MLRIIHELMLIMWLWLHLCRRGIHGMFPLHLAALSGFSDCCRKLLSSGVSHLLWRFMVFITAVKIYAVHVTYFPCLSEMPWAFNFFFFLIMDICWFRFWRRHARWLWQDLFACGCCRRVSHSAAAIWLAQKRQDVLLSWSCVSCSFLQESGVFKSVAQHRCRL